MDRIRRLWRRGEVVTLSNRYVFVGHSVPEQASPPEGYENQRFSDNEIVTSKYTAWNFLPKNLFEQFRRIANFYFLCVGIITLVIDSPVSPATTFLPLIFVVVVTGIKQGYEDFLRHRSDKEVNLQMIEVVRNGQLEEIKSKDIHVGDIIRIDEEDSFPCDLILLSSSNPEGKCNITTANLDGETNYKVKHSSKTTRDRNTPDLLEELRAHIEYQQPNVNLYQFVGTLTVYPEDRREEPTTTSLGLDNILLRGCRLKDTDYIYGCAVYTGQDTKLGLNSLLTGIKFSTVEKSMNIFLLAFLLLLIIEVSLCTIQKYVYLPYLEGADYLGPDKRSTFGGVLTDLSSFMVIFNYIIPISLYVTLEMQKFLGTFFFIWDVELYCPDADEPALCNTSDLNEELGQVQYLLTDKTGTLTENAMEFRQCSINGQKFIDQRGVLMKAEDNSTRVLSKVDQFTPEMEEFFVTLALCHTASIVGQNKKVRRTSSRMDPDGYRRHSLRASFRAQQRGLYEYQASSPDEKALAEACQRFNIVYSGEIDDMCTVKVFGRRRQYRRLHVLEFDSDRKRMSVIAEFPDESIWLLCKGAESTVLPRCIVGRVDQTEGHIKDFAMLGLRTLAIAARQLTQKEYDQIRLTLDEAQQAMTDRETAVSKAFDSIEKDMTLLGATGVEDQLQDGVEETLEALKAAGIKVWVLTGDKLETAVNIAFSCGHFKRGMEVLELSGTDNVEENLNELKSKIWNGGEGHYGFVVDGLCLAQALVHHRDLLADVASQCEAVVCCRMSPIQKAEVVKLVKNLPEGPITAAIGDGANDVSMIQEAHIGLGIMGKEGRQAVRCSDFAFARFRFLRRVLLVHGHWYYWRISTLVQYFFYKNVAFNTPVVFFAIFSAYSTQPVYDSIIFTMFNITFSALPIIVFGVFEQNFTDKQLLEHLHLYRNLSGNANMSWGQFLKWNLLGLWHAIVIYFGVHFLYYYQCDIFVDGKPMDLVTMGVFIARSVAWIVNIKLLIESRYWTLWYFLSILISVMLGFGAFMLFFCGLYFPTLNNITTLWSMMVVSASAGAWIVHFIILVLCLLPDILVGMYDSCRLRDGVDDSQEPIQQLKRKLSNMMSFIKQIKSRGSSRRSSRGSVTINSYTATTSPAAQEEAAACLDRV